MRVRLHSPPLQGLLSIATIGIDDIWGTAAGDTHSAVLRAKAEFIERMHFIRECQASFRGNLADVHTAVRYDELVKALSQVSTTAIGNQSGDDFEWNNECALTGVIVRPGNESTALPLAVLSLHGAGASFRGEETQPDQIFLDSTGCAAHIRGDLAVENAAREFLERQYYLASWLTGTVDHEIHLTSIVQFLDPLLRKTLHWLTTTGEVRMLCLFVSEAFCCVFTWHSREPRSKGQAGFSCGLGGGLTLLEAIEGSLRELWLGLIYDLCIGTLSNAGNNRYEQNARTYRKATFEGLLPTRWLHASKKNFRCHAVVSPVQTSIGVLDRISLPYYVYQRKSELFPEWHVARIFSPHYFIHIDSAGPLNLINDFFLSYLNTVGLGASSALNRTAHPLP